MDLPAMAQRQHAVMVAEEKRGTMVPLLARETGRRGDEKVN